jgi:cytosine/uracil/thiamine/allantoin permease
MLGRIKTSLIRLYGRVKNNMSTLYITIAGFCFPSGIGLFIFFMEDNNLDRFDQIGMIIAIFLLFIVAIVCWAVAIRAEKIERYKEDLKYIEQIKHLETLRQDTIASMNTVGSNINTLSVNINDLVNEIRKDRDERNKPKPDIQTPNSESKK